MTGLPGVERLGDDLGRLDDRGARRCRPAGSRASARPRGSSGRCGGTRSGPGVRARAGRSRRRARTAEPRPSRGEGAADAAQVAPRLGRAVGREAVPGVAGERRRGGPAAPPGGGRRATQDAPDRGARGRRTRRPRPRAGCRRQPAPGSGRRRLGRLAAIRGDDRPGLHRERAPLEVGRLVRASPATSA